MGTLKCINVVFYVDLCDCFPQRIGMVTEKGRMVLGEAAHSLPQEKRD